MERGACAELFVGREKARMSETVRKKKTTRGGCARAYFRGCLFLSARRRGPRPPRPTYCIVPVFASSNSSQPQPERRALPRGFDCAVGHTHHTPAHTLSPQTTPTPSAFRSYRSLAPPVRAASSLETAGVAHAASLAFLLERPARHRVPRLSNGAPVPGCAEEASQAWTCVSTLPFQSNHFKRLKHRR